MPTRIPPGLLKSILSFRTFIKSLKFIIRKFDFNIAYKPMNYEQFH